MTVPLQASDPELLVSLWTVMTAITPLLNAVLALGGLGAGISNRGLAFLEAALN